MAGPRRTKIRIGELNGAPYIEQINYATPADMELLNKARYEIEIEDGEAYVTIFLQIGDGEPTAITHSPFTGGKYDVGAIQAAMKALDISKVNLCVPVADDDEGGGDDDGDTPAEEEGEDEGGGEEAEAEAEEGEEADGDEGEGEGEDAEAEGEEGEDEGDGDEGPTLGEAADKGDAAAIKELEKLARAAGIDPDAYELYTEVEALLPEEGGDDDEPLED